MANDGGITKEEIASAKRAEEKYKEIQPIRPDFYSASAVFLSKGRKPPEDPSAKADLEYGKRLMMAASNQRNAEEVIRLRMKKIVNMAIRNSFGVELSLEFLTKEEREYFDLVKGVSCNMINKFRNVSMNTEVTTHTEIDSFTEPPKKVVEEPVRAPEVQTPVVPEPVPVQQPAEEIPSTAKVEETFDPEAEAMPFPDDVDMLEPQEEEMPDDDADIFMSPETGKNGARDDLQLIRMLVDLPEPIAGPDHNYTLRREEMVYLPKMLANALINNSMALAINPSS